MQSSADQPQPLGRVIAAVKGWIERCGWVWVEAEVTELNRRPTATQFLTLRDRRSGDTARATCTRLVLEQAGPIADGTQVAAWVKPVLWPNNASFSFECRELRIVGEGRLLAQIEQLKRKLQAEGLFDAHRKKRLPFLPRAIGLVTGANSAAEKDVVTTCRSRWPGVNIELAHTVVQGPEAAAQVIEQLRRLDADPRIEVIVIARGGGSLEDLLPFSDEGLVRAVAACRTPVVSAIGHQSDSPVLDLVADVAAITPTDAAKRVVPDAAEERERVDVAVNRLRRAVVAGLVRRQDDLDQLRTRPVLRDPTASFAVHHERIALLRDRLDRAIERHLVQEQTGLQHALTRVRTMSPKATLERGYAILVDGGGDGVTSVAQVDEGDDLMAYLADGTVVLEVREVEAHPELTQEGH